ncbi:MAG: hypothetical protein ACI4XH_01790 [Acutalibacteraceae bacterium]
MPKDIPIIPEMPLLSRKSVEQLPDDLSLLFPEIEYNGSGTVYISDDGDIIIEV